jgi:outer membrane protein assembly factor BamB
MKKQKIKLTEMISPDKKQVYAKLMNDSVIAVSTLTDQFKLNWVLSGGFGYEHVPCPIVATNDQVIIGTRQGIIISLDPRNQTINWKYKAGNSAVIRLAWDGKNKVYASLAEGKLISLKKE